MSLSRLFLKNRAKNILLRQKGFSLLELIISAGALGLFAILVQSMLVLGHSFTRSQQNLFDFLQVSRMIKQRMCMSNTAFKNINLNIDMSYKKDDEGEHEDPNDPDSPIIGHSRTYEKLTPSVPPLLDTPIMGLRISDINSTESFEYTDGHIESTISVDDIILQNSQYVVKNVDGDGDGNGDIDPSVPVDAIVYYKIYQDSHTIVKLNFSSSSITTLGGFDSGYIFASRCVKNESTYLITANDGYRYTFKPDALKESALYILSKMDYKPYYFPSSMKSTKYEVQCCKDGTLLGTQLTISSADCKSAREEWVPRIYVIHLEPRTGAGVSKYGFSGKVAHIQELPEIQDLNSIWGMGFMLSMEKKVTLSQSAFQLDTMFLKNTCSTSVVDVQKCRNLSLGTNPKDQSLHGIARKMINYIIPDVSSCAGYSTGVDGTALIGL